MCFVRPWSWQQSKVLQIPQSQQYWKCYKINGFKGKSRKFGTATSPLHSKLNITASVRTKKILISCISSKLDSEACYLVDGYMSKIITFGFMLLEQMSCDVLFGHLKAGGMYRTWHPHPIRLQSTDSHLLWQLIAVDLEFRMGCKNYL